MLSLQALYELLPTWDTRGGRVRRPFEPREGGSKAMIDTAKGIVFCDDIMSTAIASFGGKFNSLYRQ